MSLGKIKVGPYGKYYAYFHSGGWHNLGLRDQGINLTEDQLDILVKNGKLTFVDGNGKTVYAFLETGFSKKKNQHYQYIRYSGGDTSNVTVTAAQLATDKAEVEKHKAKIVEIFSRNKEFWNEKWTNDYLNKTLKLSQIYHCDSQEMLCEAIVKVTIYYGKDKTDSSKYLLEMYLKPTGKRIAVDYYSTKEYEEITEGQYRQALATYEAEQRALAAKRKKIEEAHDLHYNDVINWVKAISQDINNNAPSKNNDELIKAVLNHVQNIPGKAKAYSWRPNSLKEILSIDNVTKCFGSTYSEWRTPEEYADKAEKYKKSVLSDLRDWYDYHALKAVRDNIYNDIQSKGLEAVTDPVNVNAALNLDVFGKFKKAIKKDMQNSIHFICYDMFIDILDPDLLKSELLNMLKVYHDFYDFPAKDRKAIAKFIANNKLEDYYDAISKYDEVLEVLIDESKDTKFKKKLLVGVAGGTVDLSFLKTKSYYFERKAKLKNLNQIVLKPLQLLEDLRDLIPYYNMNSDVNIMTNIVLDDNAGYEYIFQFYTFSDDGTGNDMDGRRLQYLARLYNRDKDELHKIYFEYDM